MKNEIRHRCTRRVDVDKQRVIIGVEALKLLGICKDDNEVVVTVYDNKVVITKRR